MSDGQSGGMSGEHEAPDITRFATITCHGPVYLGEGVFFHFASTPSPCCLPLHSGPRAAVHRAQLSLSPDPAFCIVHAIHSHDMTSSSSRSELSATPLAPHRKQQLRSCQDIPLYPRQPSRSADLYSQNSDLEPIASMTLRQPIELLLLLPFSQESM
jgi:hypothetical protein